MQGLRAAGINPILAAGAGIKGGFQGSAIQAAPAQAGRGKNAITTALEAQLLSANTAKATEEAAATRFNNIEAKIRTDFLATPEGLATIRRDLISKSIPDTWSGMTGKALFETMNKIKGMSGRESAPLNQRLEAIFEKIPIMDVAPRTTAK